MPRIGFVDSVEGAVVRGWAYDEEEQTSARVAIRIDDTLVDEFEGTEFRRDLLAAGIGTGRHGFTWTIPERYRPTLLAVLRATYAQTGQSLTLGERVLFNGTLANSELFQGILSTGIWQAEAFHRRESDVVVSGWAVPPYAVPIPYVIKHNGVAASDLDTFDRPDILERLGIRRPLRNVGFRLTIPLERFSASERHEFAFAEKRTGTTFNPHHSVYQLPLSAPIADDDRRMRVGRTTDLDTYLRTGSTIYSQLDQIAEKYTGMTFSRATAILDWGCGCGRIFGFIAPEDRARLVGVDIDPDNIGWCRENFPEARFEVVPLRPPTISPAEYFDFVFSISVMTHLTAERQFEWLAELRRITRPGAVVLLSVLGETAWVNGGASLERYAEWRSSGFLNVGKNHDLDDAPVDASDYFNSFVTRAYIFEHWSTYFTVLDVVNGAVGTLQDLVVLQRT